MIFDHYVDRRGDQEISREILRNGVIEVSRSHLDLRDCTQSQIITTNQPIKQIPRM